MNNRIILYCKALLLGVLCIACEQATTSKETPAISLPWPKDGHTSVEVIDGQLVYLNALDGEIRIIREGQVDTLKNVYDTDFPFRPSDIFSLGNDLFLIREDSLQRLGAEGNQVVPLLPDKGYLRSTYTPSIKFGNSVFLHQGTTDSLSTMVGKTKRLGWHCCVAKLTFTANAGGFSVVEQAMPLPLVPFKENDGNYYGFASFLAQSGATGVLSYERYATVYLFDLNTNEVVDSVEFYDLSDFGQKPVPENASVNQKRLYYHEQPRYKAAFLKGREIWRVLRWKENQWLMTFHLDTRKLQKFKIPKERPLTLFELNGDLYRIEDKISENGTKTMHYYLLTDAELMRLKGQ